MGEPLVSPGLTRFKCFNTQDIDYRLDSDSSHKPLRKYWSKNVGTAKFLFFAVSSDAIQQ